MGLGDGQGKDAALHSGLGTGAAVQCFSLTLKRLPCLFPAITGMHFLNIVILFGCAVYTKGGSTVLAFIVVF